MPSPPTTFEPVLAYWAVHTMANQSLSGPPFDGHHGAYFCPNGAGLHWRDAPYVAWLYRDKPVLVYGRDGSYTFCCHGILGDQALLDEWKARIPSGLAEHLSVPDERRYHFHRVRGYERLWRRVYTAGDSRVSLGSHDPGALWAESVLTYAPVRP